MIAILHYHWISMTLFGVRNVSCDHDNHFSLEMMDSNNHQKVVKELNDEGFKANMLGSLITVEITAFTIFEDERKTK